MIEGALGLLATAGRRARRDHRDRARDHGRVEHGARGARRPDGADHDRGLSRRARDAAAADPGDVRPAVRQAAAARAAPPALRDRRACGAPGRGLARARSGVGGRGRRGGEARRRRLGRDRAAAFVREPRARAPGRRARAGRPRRRGLRHLLGRHPAGDSRVRADEHGRRQRLRRAGGDALHRLADREARGGRDHGAARDHAVGRRDDEPGGRAEAARLPRRVRARGRRDRLRPPGAPDRPGRT